MKMVLLLTRADGSCMVYAHVRERRDPLSAVPPELQLKYQDSGITFTNWDPAESNAQLLSLTGHSARVKLQMPDPGGRPSRVRQRAEARVLG